MVCANAVSTRIAEAVPAAVAVTHQHGCAQVGDDARQTTASLERLARHPNAWATLVVSLGCETLQGMLLAERLRADGVDCAFVGIQTEGGSHAAIDAGIRELSAVNVPVDSRTRSSDGIPIALTFVGEHEELAAHYADVLRAQGFDVTGPVNGSTAPVLTSVEVTLAAGALAMILVGDKLVNAPILTPLLAIATDEDRFRTSEGEFDLVRPGDPELVEAVVATLSGERTASERRGDCAFSVRRTLVTL